MNARQAPRLPQALLRLLVDARYRESLEGDLLEQLAAGRSALWYWRQVAGALHHHALYIARENMWPLLAATMFFLLALWVIAPATYPLLDWARAQESVRILVLSAWLAGIPLLLGGIAGSSRRGKAGVILLAAGLAWLTPLALPFGSAVCDLCASPTSTPSPDALWLLMPLVAAPLAACGASMARRLHLVTN